MRIFLAVAGVIAWLISFLILASANGLPQQLFSGEVGIIGTILFASAAIVEEVGRVRKAIESQAVKSPS